MKIPPKKHHSSFRFFLKHFTRNFIVGFFITVLMVIIGMLGFHHYEKSEWIDAYANSAMIISGVGTLTNPNTFDGKLFVATYSLIGAGGYLVIIGIIFAPVFHWIFRKIQLEDREYIKE